MQNKAVFYFHFDTKCNYMGNLPGARLLWNALVLHLAQIEDMDIFLQETVSVV